MTLTFNPCLNQAKRRTLSGIGKQSEFNMANKLTSEQILAAIQSDSALGTALAQQLGLRYMPRARVSAPTSKKGNVYLALREGRSNLSVMPSRNAGEWLVFGGRGRGAQPFPYKVGISKDQNSLICSVSFPIQNDTERKIIKDFMAGKIKPTVRAEPETTEEAPSDEETTEEAPSDDTEETPTPTKTAAKGKTAGAASEEIKMAKELVEAGEYSSVAEALKALRAA